MAGLSFTIRLCSSGFSVRPSAERSSSGQGTRPRCSLQGNRIVFGSARPLWFCSTLLVPLDSAAPFHRWSIWLFSSFFASLFAMFTSRSLLVHLVATAVVMCCAVFPRVASAQDTAPHRLAVSPDAVPQTVLAPVNEAALRAEDAQTRVEPDRAAACGRGANAGPHPCHQRHVDAICGRRRHLAPSRSVRRSPGRLAPL